MDDEIAELEDRAAQLDRELSAAPQFKPRYGETPLGVWRDALNGDRALRFTRIEHPLTPRVVVALWYRSDSGTWCPVREGRLSLRLIDLASFARTLAGVLRAAVGHARAAVGRELDLVAQRQAAADVHMRARAAANAEAEDVSSAG